MKSAIVRSLSLLLIVNGIWAFGADEPATSAMPVVHKVARVAIANPRSVAIDRDGNIYVADDAGGAVMKITAEGQVSVLGGSGAASIADPLGLAVDRKGTVLVADASGNAVHKIAVGGAAVSAVKAEDVSYLVTPTGVAVDAAGNAYVTNNGDNTILKITPQGVVSVLAGKSGNSGSADGKGEAASFATPRGIGIDGKENLYVADEGNSNIRKITPAGEVSTLAGSAGQSGSADGKGAAARFAGPRALAAAADGTVYVADTDSNIIRKITPEGVVTTLAGKAGEVGRADGKGEAARFSEPRGIAVDGAGNVFVADSGNGAIRQIAPEGVVTTITVSPDAPTTGAATKP